MKEGARTKNYNEYIKSGVELFLSKARYSRDDHIYRALKSPLMKCTIYALIYAPPE